MSAFFPYAQVTADITVRVAPRYLPDQSDPDDGRYAWSYHVRIENGSTRDVQLISRHWIITDARGHVEEVEGEGVVGEQPLLGPGESFDYVSGCPLPTPSGTMHGTYAFAADGGLFAVAIPMFSLDIPHERGAVH
ncbi:Co2+/Mg2+ efflux protein ApaG [Glacieibacterium frigidum]|uniref:Protein ApaG n=1 Tax=Glacieibacterium frigidum TaxID=2593303 RepID=A0A552UJS5_9SPHN|nr:Co2+/Mg2+ efflux protein ApaG [Glacieibacterium frigidum]TRW18482.1 Co2+/Mg2+ efflux protein ApaG [Glacieibacterium frigidum]